MEYTVDKWTHILKTCECVGPQSNFRVSLSEVPLYAYNTDLETPLVPDLLDEIEVHLSH